MKTTITITIDHHDLDKDLGELLAKATPLSLQRDVANASGILSDAVAATSVDCFAVERTGGWMAGWNKPGYLPDDEPQLFETFDAAQDYLLDELERAREERIRLTPANGGMEVERGRIRELYRNAIVAVRALERVREDFVRCGSYVWWIRPEVDA